MSEGVVTVTHKPTGKRGYLFGADMLEDAPFHVSLEDGEGAVWCEASELETDAIKQFVEINDPAGCGFRQGPEKTCVYLTLGGDPFISCTRGTPLQKIIEERVAEGSMNAQYRPTAMFPDCQHSTSEADSAEESATAEAV